MPTVIQKQPLLRVYTEAPRPEDIKERILGYGRSSTGKTRWGLSLPDRYGKIAYFCADDNAEYLHSIAVEKHARIVRIIPEGDDPTASFQAFCMRDWKKVDPAIGTLVVDTFTKVGMDSVAFSANTGAMDREKHYHVGVVGEGGVAIPNRGDYQALDALGKGYLDTLFKMQRDLHIIFLCHEDVKVIGGVARGGPSFPGWTMMEYMPGEFSTVVRLIKEQQLVKGADMPEDVVVAIGENDGKFIAKVRTNDETKPNKMARVVLNRNPLNWWEAYDAYLGIKKEAA